MDFALILFILVIITGIMWVADKAYFLPRRRVAAQQAVATLDKQLKPVPAPQQDKSPKSESADAVREKLYAAQLRQPWWLEYTAGFFPVVLFVFLLRSFVVEPFKIPSGSMIPTLLVGDYILVNKFDYGIRLPVIDDKVLSIGEPKRGDIAVFRYPRNQSVDYIKRIIGLPGDVVSYHNKQLSINGKLVPETPLTGYSYQEEDQAFYAQKYEETLGGQKNAILKMPDRPAWVPPPHNFPFSQNCTFDGTGVTCTVPAGYYFAMGDNRDDSEDSRYWGFVPEKNLVGRAFFVWMNFHHLDRIGPLH